MLRISLPTILRGGGLSVVLACAGHGAAAQAAPPTPQPPASGPARGEAEAGLAQAHPTALYAHAAQRFREGAKDDAVMWFYVGQLRLRFHVAAHPDLPRDREPALLASLNATVGQTINEWAGGSPRQWAAAIDRALAWDAANDDATTSRQRHPAVWQAQRRGLEGLRDSILANEASIREQRRQRGLENR